MTKEQMIERLQALANVLGREADISGSKADLEQRLAEWEEEAECFQIPDDISGGGTESGNLNSIIPDPAERIRVRMKVTAHLEAFDDNGTRRMEFAAAGQIVRVEHHLLAGLMAAGVAEVCDA